MNKIKLNRLMKNLSWQFWVAIGIIVAVVITEIVLCFVNPWAAVWGAAGFVFGALGTYFYIKYKQNKDK